jgi:hypothetical protein
MLYSKTPLIPILWDILERFTEHPTNQSAAIRLAFFKNAIIILSDSITKQLFYSFYRPQRPLGREEV